MRSSDILREGIPFDDDFDGVVMTVEVFALSLIVPKGVRGAEFGTEPVSFQKGRDMVFLSFCMLLDRIS